MTQYTKFDNCNLLYAGISSYEAGRLRKFQSACARLIYSKKKGDYVSSILQEFHWLSYKARTYFKILCYVLKCLHDLAPSYLSKLLLLKQQ